MSEPVEGKPGVRLVWWCVRHDAEAIVVNDEDGERWCVKGWHYWQDEGICRAHRFELRPHGYERNIEWGEQ